MVRGLVTEIWKRRGIWNRNVHVKRDCVQVHLMEQVTHNCFVLELVLGTFALLYMCMWNKYLQNQLMIVLISGVSPLHAPSSEPTWGRGQ